MGIVLEIKSRWWLPVYLRTLTLICILACREPDYDKVSKFIVRYGISQKVKACPSTT